MLGRARTSAAGKIGTKQVLKGEETASVIIYESPGGRKQATELSAAAGVDLWFSAMRTERKPP